VYNYLKASVGEKKEFPTYKENRDNMKNERTHIKIWSTKEN
jgi:hypothetical protein